MKDLKYLAAYIVPVLSFWSLYAGGICTLSTVVFVFVVVPLLEPLLPNDSSNLSDDEKLHRSKKIFFDWLLYLNVPIVFGLIMYYLYLLKHFDHSLLEMVGMLTAVGLTMSSAGINVAHELGHRPERYHKFLSVLLLLPSIYCHFILEHNLGHHKNVGTDDDPASARRGENLYRFWMRSVIFGYLDAWQIEIRRLDKETGIPKILKNKMVHYTVIQLIWLAAILLYGGIYVGLIYAGTAVFSFLMLETINYIEHYGLRRKRLDNGRYERVAPRHSWNSNHELGRILLYELTRHSDHHYLANKKYQLLDHHHRARQLPVGYPTSMLLSMMPPLWFRVMDRRIDI